MSTPEPVHSIKVRIDVTTVRQSITIKREYGNLWTAIADLKELFAELKQLIGVRK